MTENKLTDKEIIRVLECCASGKNCEECSLNCEAPTTKDILDVINRKDAEVERLNVELIGIRGACNSYKMHYDNTQAELEEARIGVKSYKGKYESTIETARELKLVIAEKDAEIERLSNSAKQWEETSKDLFISKEKQQAEIVELKNLLDSRHRVIERLENMLIGLEDEIRAEVIKEFTERFEAYIPNIEGETTMECVKNAIKQTLKEMVGEQG